MPKVATVVLPNAFLYKDDVTKKSRLVMPSLCVDIGSLSNCFSFLCYTPFPFLIFVTHAFTFSSTDHLKYFTLSQTDSLKPNENPQNAHLTNKQTNLSDPSYSWATPWERLAQQHGHNKR